MANRDVDVRDDTWTRSQLLTERGYPPEIVNGNGRHDGGEVTPATSAPVDVDAGARSCSECGGPVAAGRSKTCGPVCAKARDHRQERERRKRARRSASVERRGHVGSRKTDPTPAAHPGPELVTIAPPVELVTIAPPAELEAGDGVTVSLADELEEAARLLRSIARRLTG